MLMGKVIRAGAVFAAVVMLAGGTPANVGAAKNPAKASVKCRKVIGQNVLKAVTTGLKAIQQCHARQLKNHQGGDCNALAGSAFDQAQTQAVARIQVACKDGDPVLANYAPASVSGGLPPVLDAIQAALEQSGKALQGLPGFDGDPEVKVKTKCSSSVGTARTAVVKAALKAALKCQQGIDKSATLFGPLDTSCLAASGSAGGKASGKVQKACGSLSGLDVGSCAALPGCLVADAEGTAHQIARLAFGGPSVCGDGIKDLSEECDDGNAVEDDGCRANCLLPVCGDLLVNEPSEQCDEPNGVGGDQPNESCYQCKLNVCGDGFLDTQEPGIEECDDGNTQAGDGCTNCKIDPTLCDAMGLTVTVGLDFPVQTVGDLAGATLDLGYPAFVNIPGSGTDSSVRSRVMSLLPSGFSFHVNDQDTSLHTETAGAFVSISPGPLFEAQFDCPSGTPARVADFSCAMQLTDRTPAPLSPELAKLVHCVVTLGGGLAPTTTTTITTTSTTIGGPTTSTSTLPSTCGNGMTEGTEECDDGNTNSNDGCTNFCTICGNSNVTAPETCDDGNNLLDDNCPEDCQIGACAPTANTVQTITITASRPDLTSIRFLLDYPDGQVALPGGPGPDLPPGTLTDTPGDPTPFDLEHAVRIVVAAGFTFDTTTIGKLNFLGCTGQPVPSAADYHCIVIDASDGSFNNVTGVTCTVSTP